MSCSSDCGNKHRRKHDAAGSFGAPRPRGAPRKRAALLLRVSTNEQNSDAQRPELEEMAAARGFDVVEVFDESGVSGVAPRRPVLRSLLEGAHRGRFDVVLVWALDRIGRSSVEVIQVVQQLDAARVQLISAREAWLDLAGPTRALLLAIFGWLAEFERDRLIERTRAGMDRARRAGRIIGRPEAAVPLAMAQALTADGMSVRATARKLGVAPSTLRRKLKQ